MLNIRNSLFINKFIYLGHVGPNFIGPKLALYLNKNEQTTEWGQIVFEHQIKIKNEINLRGYKKVTFFVN